MEQSGQESYAEAVLLHLAIPPSTYLYYVPKYSLAEIIYLLESRVFCQCLGTGISAELVIFYTILY